MPKRLDLLLEMLKNEPHDAFLNYALALEHIKTNDLAEAIHILEDVLAKDVNYLAAYYQLGKLYEQKSQTDKAIVMYKRGMEIAQLKKDAKTFGELEEALMIIDED